MDEGHHFSSMTVMNKRDNFSWEIINVYGPVRNEKKVEFLRELYQNIQKCSKPLVICGDFNMIRYHQEKSSGAIHNI
jgi:exonuclease III